MTLYAIGDLQGCYDQLRQLLDAIQFNPQSDQVWFTGDLVNRGPKSLQTLRMVKNLGPAAVTVLGNHDLHCLACFHGTRNPHKSDTFKEIFAAKDCEELMDWLRYRPLLHVEHGFCLVHAGFAPQWDLRLAEDCAREAEQAIRSNAKYLDCFQNMYGDHPDRWHEKLTGWSKIRFIINTFTRMRFCTQDGAIDTRHKGKPGSQPENLIPWFDVTGRKSVNLNIIFGHWSTLGLNHKAGAYGLDSGCLWGGHLTALKLEPEKFGDFIQVQCKCTQPIGS